MTNTRPHVLGIALACAGVLGLGCNASEQSAELTDGQAILEELREIRKLLEATPPRSAATVPAARPERTEVSLADGHIMGSDEAPLTLLEFTDYQCPYCSRFSRGTLPALKQRYIDTGQLRLVSRDLPLAMHGNAERAATAARCADEQDRYWEMRALMFVNTDQLAQESLTGYADDLDLDVARFSECLTSDRYGDAVRQGAADAAAIGITGTPTFVLGRTSGDQLEGAIIRGAQPFTVFDNQIKTLLAESD